MRNWWRRLIDGVLPAGLAILVICVWSATDWRGRSENVAVLEQRRPTVMPAMTWANLGVFPSAFGAFFDDHFGLRQRLIDLRGRIMAAWFGRATTTDVIIGRDGWLFLAANGSLRDFRRLDPFKPAELDAFVHTFQVRKAWFAARGVRYLFVVAPDKHSIYPELMPRDIARTAGQSKLDQIAERLSGDPDFLDLRPALWAAKPEGRLYFQRDTHWNPVGSYLGYRAIMEHLALTPVDIGREAFAPIVMNGLDLARLIGLSMPELAPRFPDPPPCVRPTQAAVDVASLDVAPDPPLLTPSTECAGGTDRLLMLHDSFGQRMARYFSAGFARAVYVFRRPSLAQIARMVEAEHPTVVIEERVERYLREPFPP